MFRVAHFYTVDNGNNTNLVNISVVLAKNICGISCDYSPLTVADLKNSFL